jgi:opacity protein-like surface antigen
MVRRAPVVLMIAFWFTAMPAASRAQTVVKYIGVFSPYIGVTTGADVEDPGFTFGASLAVLDEMGWGAELDVAHATTVGDEGLDDSGLTSGMLHVAYYWARGRIRPYGVAGAGVLRLSGIRAADGGQSRTDWGLSFGGGAHAPLNEVLGVRGDVRYIRFLESHADVLAGDGVFGAWRLSVGLAVNWPLEP